MSTWWAKLPQRERRVLLLGGAVVAAVLIWALIWDPLARSNARLAADLGRAESDLAFMREAAPRMAGAKGNASVVGAERAGRSLPALADATAREAGLGGALRRIEPVGQGRVSLSFEGIGFDPWIGWLEAMSARFGVRVESMSVERQAAAGMVNAQVVLVDPREGN